MTEKTLIELSEKDLKEVLCKYFGLQENTAYVNITKQEHDRGGLPYFEIKVTGTKVKP